MIICQLCNKKTNKPIVLQNKNWQQIICPDCMNNLKKALQVIETKEKLKSLIGELDIHSKQQSENTIIWSTENIDSDEQIYQYIQANWDICIENELTTKACISEILYQQCYERKQYIINDLNNVIKELYPNGIRLLIRTTFQLWDTRSHIRTTSYNTNNASVFFKNRTCNTSDNITLYIDEQNELILKESHHDGINTSTFYILKPDADDTICSKYHGDMLKKYTIPAYDLFKHANLVD